ncbi:MAG: hypothetical protein EA347_01090 [Thioalkalivibrio sp.]|nr:MAG: hypothetical protein EA347_01090 [Thioalkalivibrio sp.]
MCTFNWFVGESLRIEDPVCIHFREAERDQVRVTIEQLGGEGSTVELISPRYQEDIPEPETVE